MTVETYDIDALITKLSSFGNYQKKNFILISLAVLYSSVQYSYVFSTRSTKHRCYIEECEEDLQPNLEYNQPWLGNAIPSDGSTFRKCERYAPISHTILDHEVTNFCGAISFNTSDVHKCTKLVTDGSDLTTIEHDFELTCNENLWKLTALGSLDEIAELLFAPFVGYFSDRCGRKWVLVNSLVFSGICGTIKALSPSYIVFAIMEFITACFTSGIYGSCIILGLELLVAEQRVFGSTVLAIAFPFGEIFVGLAAWFSPSWSIMLMVIYTPGILFIFYLWLMDDSLLFLLTNGKMKKARRVIERITRANNLEISTEMNLDNLKDNTQSPSEHTDNDEKRESFIQVFKYPSMIFRVINCSISWISCTFIFYGLTVYSVSLTGNIYLNFIIIAIIELPAYVICYYMLDSIGRRYTLIVSLLISGVACLSCAFIPEELWILQLVLPIVGKCTATMAFKTIYIYTAEMFPTTLRHTFLAFCSMFGRGGSIAAPQLPLMATISPLLPPILFGSLGLIAGFLAFFLPETAGCKLPDTLEEALVIGKKEKSDVDNIN